MKNLLLWLMAIVLSSCTTDVLLPCSEDGVAGELCREYRYFNDSPVGYVTFAQQGDSLMTSNSYNQASNLEKTVTEQFDDGRISIISEKFPDKESRVQTWHYNEMDSLWLIVYGANDSSLEISYENGKRLREVYSHQGVMKRYNEYRYFTDDGQLYRIYNFGGDGALLRYRSFEYFHSTGQTRVSYYSAENDLVGKRVYNSQNGLITSIVFSDNSGTVTERSDYIYDASLHLVEKTEMKGIDTYKSVFIYH